jgi:predicted alpha-1,6-mannanase (GH76 family)
VADPTPTDLDARAAEAERSVTRLFGRRLAGLPGTHLAAAAAPAPGGFAGWRVPWHPWWQAHYLDALVDAGRRSLRSGDVEGAVARCWRGDRLLATIHLRNGGWTGGRYDDLAWLALASGRLGRLHHAVSRRRGLRRHRSVRRTLVPVLRSGLTDDLGGGLFVSTDREAKNLPASGPAALLLARLGDLDGARRVVDWAYERLWSPDTGLFADGLRIRGHDVELDPGVWSYNQGTVLATLVTVGDPRSLARAADLVAAVDAGLATDVAGRRVLRTHDGGDGGLYTGILVRYLALAADTDQLAAPARETAARLVRDTAAALWDGRADRALPHRSTRVAAFPTDLLRPAAAQSGGVLELSTQLQAWTALEAAARLR